MPDGSLFLFHLTGPTLTPTEAALFRKLQPAGYILSEQNLVSPEQTRRLTDDLRDLSTDTPLIAIAQEGGNASPLAKLVPAPPSPAALAARKDLGKIADAGAFTGDLLRLLGINLNLAPVLDFDHPHGVRWGSDPQRIIDYAGQWNRWLRKRGVAGCAGSFPAGGADLTEQPATIDELLRGGILPYTALMPEIDAVMISNAVFPHIDPGLPASLSARIVRRFLRDQLGFDKHFALTDNPDPRAIEAGNDVIVLRQGADHEAAATALSALPHWATEDARLRLDRFRKNKLHGPLKWSEEKWSTVCAAIVALAGEFPDTNVKTSE